MVISHNHIRAVGNALTVETILYFDMEKEWQNQLYSSEIFLDDLEIESGSISVEESIDIGFQHVSEVVSVQQFQVSTPMQIQRQLYVEEMIEGVDIEYYEVQGERVINIDTAEVIDDNNTNTNVKELHLEKRMVEYRQLQISLRR